MTDPKVDAYIENAAEFAQPILRHIRALVHKAVPHVEEAMKWSMPFFTLGGKNLASMAAFKGHAAFGFWEGLDVKTPKADKAMGHFGKITALSDLPPDDELMELIQSVVAKMGARKAAKKPKSKPVKVPAMPEDFAVAIAANSLAQQAYDSFAPGQKRDYIEWITEAKREATREKRMKQAVEWMAEGKDRNWKYR